jgi:hypothetical protein
MQMPTEEVADRLVHNGVRIRVHFDGALAPEGVGRDVELLTAAGQGNDHGL